MAQPIIPPGLRDILPQEAAELRAIEAALSQSFRAFGYGEVVVPTFEYYDLLASETGDLIRREMFKFFDQDGRIVALRPELTTPIARLAAQRLKEAELPIRLYYVQNVFRQEAPQRGQQREFRQAGVELIGDASPQADAEILSLMVESLGEAGLRNYEIGVGQVAYVTGLIDEIGEDTVLTRGGRAAQAIAEGGYERLRKELRDALVAKDLVGLGALTEDMGRTGEALRALPTLRGADAFDRASEFASNERSAMALENLRAITDLAQAAGVADRIVPDLGIVRNIDYYTGAIFEAYAAGLGFAVSGGGRYDALCATFGWSQPATGFQHGVERLHIALSMDGEYAPLRSERPVFVTYEEDAGSMFAAARLLRREGIPAQCLLSGEKPAASDAFILIAGRHSCTVISPLGAETFVVALSSAGSALREMMGASGAAATGTGGVA